MPSDSQSASTAPARTSARSDWPQSRPSHGHPLHLEARLQQVTEWKRSFETPSVALFRDFALSCDERAVREEVVGEVLGAEIVVGACQIEELARERFGALDFAEGHQHLADADESACLATTISEALGS